MHEVLSTHRSEFPGGEDAPRGNRPHRPLKHPGIVMGPGEQSGAPVAAGEHEGGVGLPPLEIEAQPLVGGPAVAPVEPDRAPERDLVVDGHGPAGPVHTDDVAHQEVGRAGRAIRSSMSRPTNRPSERMAASSAGPRCRVIWSTMHSMAGTPATS